MSPATQQRTAGESTAAELHTTTALKNSFLDFWAGFGEGTDRIADVIVDDTEEGRRMRGKRIRQESVAMARRIAHDIRRDMAGTSLGGVVRDTSHGMGRFSRTVLDLDYDGGLHRAIRTTGKAYRTTKNADYRRILYSVSRGTGRLAGITSNALCWDC